MQTAIHSAHILIFIIDAIIAYIMTSYELKIFRIFNRIIWGFTLYAIASTILLITGVYQGINQAFLAFLQEHSPEHITDAMPNVDFSSNWIITIISGVLYSLLSIALFYKRKIAFYIACAIVLNNIFYLVYSFPRLINGGNFALTIVFAVIMNFLLFVIPRLQLKRGYLS